MRLSKLVNPIVAVIALALGGCAAPTGDATESSGPVGTTSQAVETSPIALASGGFGILSGLITAYNTIDSLATNGTTNPTSKMMSMLKEQNAALAKIQETQNAQFLQLKVDVVINTVTDSELKISRAWADYETAEANGQAAGYVPSELTWADIDVISARLAGANGTSSAFQLIAEKMLATPGSAVKDPLGTYAVRMRMRLAQGTFLMTRAAGITPSQLRMYANQVEQLNEGFAKATRWYFLSMVAPLEGQSGVSSQCLTSWNWYFTVNNGDSDSKSYQFEEDCEAARQNWQYLTVAPKRAEMANTVWAQQENFANWKKRKNTIHVKSATYYDADVTKAVSLMCNTVENCSFPASRFAERLGADASRPGTLDVTYVCVGSEADERRVVYRPGQDAALSCNIRRAIAGDYVNPAHDATGTRGPEDEATLVPNASNNGSLDWKDMTGAFTGSLIPTEFGYSDLLFLPWNGPQTNVTVQWGDDGIPLQILGANKEWLTYVSPPKSAADAAAYEQLSGYDL